MATLVLAGLGTVVGGPVGRAVGAIIGNQIDHAIFGGGDDLEGARLKELSLTTSSYGQPLPRQFGRMRVGGTVIWATDIQENSSSEGGGKGQPSTTTYNYSASFAVALSSTPIQRIGRIWADGNLLRGVNGDLKVEGVMRMHSGEGDSNIDPLIAADHGAQAPAFRDCAYVVFENLALADFGNRIPALTFEVFAIGDAEVSLSRIVPDAIASSGQEVLPFARGIADEGGGTLRTLSAITNVLPLACVTRAEGVTITPLKGVNETQFDLPEKLASFDNPDGPERHNRRSEVQETAPVAVRYYDEDRDYQPGVQRAVGMRPNGLENMVDLPVTMTSSSARQLANENAQRARWRRERVTWRVGVIDPEITPGSLARIPGTPGVWRVMSWEWYDRGVELELERVPPAAPIPIIADPGIHLKPIDVPNPPTWLDFLEAPSDGTSPFSAPILLAVASSQTSAWRGAQIYADQGGTLPQLGSASSSRAVAGQLTAPLGASDASLLEPNARFSVELIGDDLGFEPTNIAGLANGTNRLLIGGEILQFLDAVPVGERTWEISGLLRGRAGTEDFASQGHPAGEMVVLLDNRLTAIDVTNAASLTTNRIAATGRGDAAPVFASLRNPGLSRRPLSPVHPRIAADSNGEWELCWTRRARGSWLWQDGVDTPLVEEFEQYQVGYGPPSEPHTTWTVSAPSIRFSQTDRLNLIGQYGGASLWVRQIGTYSSSAALFLSEIN